MEDMNFANRWMTGALMTDDAYYSRGFEKYDIVSPLKEGSISVGDFVSVQNRAGVVTAVIKSNLTNNPYGDKFDGDIVGITVMEDLRYLPKDWKSNPTGYGYDASGVGMSKTYVFGDAVLAGYRNGGGDIEAVPFYGSLMILKQNKADKSTWNDIMQAVERYKEKYD